MRQKNCLKNTNKHWKELYLYKDRECEQKIKSHRNFTNYVTLKEMIHFYYKILLQIQIDPPRFHLSENKKEKIDVGFYVFLFCSTENGKS